MNTIWIGQAVRLIGFGVSGSVTGARQLSLWDKPDEKSEQLAAALRRLRARYGERVVQRGAGS